MRLDAYLVVDVSESGTDVVVFSNDAEGLAEAKKYFEERVKEITDYEDGTGDVTEADLKAILDAENYEWNYGEYITISTATKEV